MKHGQKLHREKNSGQSVFFSSFPTIAASPSAASEHHVSSVDEWSEGERLAGEYAMLGFYISGHPLDKFAGRLKELNAIEIGSLEGRRNGSDVIVAGIIVQSRPDALEERRALGHRHATRSNRRSRSPNLPRSLSTPGANPKRRVSASSERTHQRRRSRHAPCGSGSQANRANVAARASVTLRARRSKSRRPGNAERTRSTNGQPPRTLPRRI